MAACPSADGVATEILPEASRLAIALAVAEDVAFVKSVKKAAVSKPALSASATASVRVTVPFDSETVSASAIPAQPPETME